MKDFSQNIPMRCSVCGNDHFSAVDIDVESIDNAPDNAKIRCSDCGHICTKEELISDNKDIINANIEDIKKEAIHQLEKEMKKMIKGLR